MCYVTINSSHAKTHVLVMMINQFPTDKHLCYQHSPCLLHHKPHHPPHLQYCRLPWPYCPSPTRRLLPGPPQYAFAPQLRLLRPHLRLDRHLFLRQSCRFWHHLWNIQRWRARLVHVCTFELDDRFVEDGHEDGHDLYDFGVLHPYWGADCRGAD